MILQDFQVFAPRFSIDQDAALAWLAQAHAQAESADPQIGESSARENLARKYSALFRRYGCSSDRIRTRGSEVPDFSHTDWTRMELFTPGAGPHGPSTTERTRIFKKAGHRVFSEAYPPGATPPDHLIHVTCTGYVSPSCAQEVVSRNGWHDRTVVTHAYHMGCYGSIPALRIASGFLANPSRGKSNENSESPRVDILHTEVCSIHLDPGAHSPEQLVVQSLFADGFIRYSARLAENSRQPQPGPGLKLESTHEVVIPDSLDAISWETTEWGMRMGLSKEVPELIGQALGPFVDRLCDQAGVSFAKIAPLAVFALHPGGPRIIDQIKARFRLSQEQTAASEAVLRQRGNMSSATLPHIWESIVGNPEISEGTYVVSLAFGPGLCVSGALLRKSG